MLEQSFGLWVLLALLVFICCSHLVYFLFFICFVSFIFFALDKFDLIWFDLIWTAELLYTIVEEPKPGTNYPVWNRLINSWTEFVYPVPATNHNRRVPGVSLWQPVVIVTLKDDSIEISTYPNLQN